MKLFLIVILALSFASCKSLQPLRYDHQALGGTNPYRPLVAPKTVIYTQPIRRY